MQQHTVTEYEVNPAHGDNETPPRRFRLDRLAVAMERRSDRETWQRNYGATKREELAVFTRHQLAKLIAQGSDWLAYVSDDEP